ncbi:hypothetical protein [Desulfotomaculum copahuensis]|uniref:Methionine synthase n=1 Tax=Desulfotomaculum copahuensis TaxID=1838280 RepID=A0A1B7LEY7_9FIRM|nr:hypothetical protein [Desulfotomaculum copahuensis]OAT81818.1 hypothetical protein A6M21_10520 [Desulfotomaculum copahuensis]
MAGFAPGGLATGIGSLPYLEPGQALPLIFSHLPQIPHWPQLPRRGGREGFVFQFLNPLLAAGLLSIEDGRAFFDDSHPAWPERLTDFYTTYLAAEAGDEKALQAFAFPREAAAGFYAFLDYIRSHGTGEAHYFKGHLAGPLTIAFQLKNRAGRLAYYEEQLRELVVKTLAMHALWQAKTLAGAGRPAIIFVDEPAVSVYGQSNYITVTRQMIRDDLNAVFEAVRRAGALTGVHSCAAVDWSLLTGCDLDIINLDAYNFGASLFPYARELNAFLQQGGVLAWGVVPTAEEAYCEDANSLLKRLSGYWDGLCRRGVDRGLLQRQAIITPACGTGLLPGELAGRIYALNREVAHKVQKGEI